MQWWLVWTIVGGVVLLSVLLVAVPAMAVRRRVAELNRVQALVQERTAARTQTLMAGSERVRATLEGVQRRTGAMQRKIEFLKTARAGELPAGTGTDGSGLDGGAGRR